MAIVRSTQPATRMRAFFQDTPFIPLIVSVIVRMVGCISLAGVMVLFETYRKKRAALTALFLWPFASVLVQLYIGSYGLHAWSRTCSNKTSNGVELKAG